MVDDGRTKVVSDIVDMGRTCLSDVATDIDVDATYHFLISLACEHHSSYTCSQSTAGTLVSLQS